MAGGPSNPFQGRLSPSTLAKLRRAVGFDTSDLHPRFILTQQSLEELVRISEDATTARRIRSIGLAALLVNVEDLLRPKTGFRQSYLNLRGRVHEQQLFLGSNRPFELIVRAFHNLAQHENLIRLLVYDDTDEAGRHFEKGLHFDAHYGPWGTDPGTPIHFRMASLEIIAFDQMSYPLDPYVNAHPGQFMPTPQRLIDCPLWDPILPIYYRSPVKFRVSRPSRRTCSELSVVPILNNSRLQLEMRSVVSGTYTQATHPENDFDHWCRQIQHTFPFGNVSSLLIEDCKVATWTARDDFRSFVQELTSLTFSGVELIVEGRDNYRELVRFLHSLRGLPMLAHIKFKNVTISYDYEDDDLSFVWRRTRLQLKKDKYEWNTAIEVQQGLVNLIRRFDNNADP
ncbi:unnamed protein product [Aureobasidium mustum]|uniref:Uncharacterized protein n=1 Tax=Aureobasidium mustum TaxID=2773714 RepID=A0A9N8JR26_9PEZI|nr:unnamed protein product [Aureobasidium mustum]